MLEVENVSMMYNKNKALVLNEISIKVREGECLAIVGSSGCGKTTLLNIIGGVIEPTAGEVTFDGKKISEIKHEIAIVFQGYGLFPWKTVKQNILLPLKLKRQRELYKKADEMIEELGLDGVKDLFPSQLSGGQKQRVAIARALMSYPKIILMDEPFSALDPMMREKLYIKLRKYFKKHNMMVVIVTHSVKEAVYFGDKVLVLSEDKDMSLTIENHSVGTSEMEAVHTISYAVRKAMVGGL